MNEGKSQQLSQRYQLLFLRVLTISDNLVPVTVRFVDGKNSVLLSPAGFVGFYWIRDRASSKYLLTLTVAYSIVASLNK